jgi:hypothetical protein
MPIFVLAGPSATQALKLLLVPSLIYFITIAGRRWGARVAGWLAAFPVIAAPLLVVIALEHGPAFGVAAAAGTLLAIVPYALFCLTHAWCARRMTWLGSLTMAFSVYTVAILLVSQLMVGVARGAAFVVAVLVFVHCALPRTAGLPFGAPFPPPAVGLRMLLAGLLVFLTTTLASVTGPRWSGILAMFPILGSVIVGFTHRRDGAVCVLQALHGIVYGLWAFVAYCVTWIIFIPRIRIFPASGLATLAALGVHGVAGYILQRTRFESGRRIDSSLPVPRG